MAYKIIQPSTNPDTLGRGGVVIPGTPDQSIQFPTGEGTIALTSQIPNTPTIYPLTTRIDVNTTSTHLISDWDLSFTSGKKYKIEYYLYGKVESTSWYGIAQFYYTGSSISYNGFSISRTGTYSYTNGINYDWGQELNSVYIENVASSGQKDCFAYFHVVIQATETGTFRHLLRDRNYSAGYSGSLLPEKTYMIVTELN